MTALAPFALRQQLAWSSPPVDDAGYQPAAELLDWTDDRLRELIERAAKARYEGSRNHRGLWRDLMGLDLGGRRVMDFGCGTGIEATELARAGNKVTIADISEANLDLAERVMGLSGFKPAGRVLVGMEPPYIPAEPGSLDTFNASGVLHHIPWARQIMEEAHALLRPVGEVRLMLYSEIGWKLATGTEPPENAPAHPAFARFVRHFDDVGEYADWYSADRLIDRFGDLFTLTRWDYLTPDKGFMAAALTRLGTGPAERSLHRLSPARHADTWDWCGSRIGGLVRDAHDPAVTQILDVGACWGKYRYLLPEYRMMDACELWLPYVVEENLASMYRSVYVTDICDYVDAPSWRSYDVVIMGDVFEHIGREPAKAMLERVLDTCGDVIVAVPFLNEQGPEHGNPHQCHLQADLTPELMAAEFPRLHLVDTEMRDGRPFKGLYQS